MKMMKSDRNAEELAWNLVANSMPNQRGRGWGYFTPTPAYNT